MSGPGTLRVALALVAFLASLSLVIWRQSQALELLGELDAVRSRRAAVESQKSQLVSRIQYLESRSRIAEVAGARWGMRVPQSDEEFVILVRPGLDPDPRRGGRVRMARAGVLGFAFPDGAER